MTLPVFLAESTAIPDRGELFRWSGAESDHARKAMRVRVGEQLELVDGDGLRVTCTVQSVADNSLLLIVNDSQTDELPSVSVTLVQALAKGGRDEQAIEMCTELGVDHVVPWQAQRSIAKWPQAKLGRSRQKWINIIRGATKQSRRSYEPEVAELVSSQQLADRLGQWREDGTLVLVAHESSDAPLQRVVSEWSSLNETGSIALIVGPEGGISDGELDDFVAEGAQPVRVGPLVLRSSTAGVAALSVINVLAGRWQ